MCYDMRRYEKMAEASHYAFLYEIETYCPKKQRQVKLTSGSNIKQDGEIVKGKPIFCNFEFVCSKTPPEKCFLNSISIETRRRRP
jgi:hypothetical protein